LTTLSSHKIEARAEEVRGEGYTVLEQTLPPELVNRMQVHFESLLGKREAAEGSNRGPRRYQMYLPWEAPFSDPLLYENEEALAILETLLGSDCALVYFASDTPLPGSEHQRVHADTRQLFPETSLVPPVYGAVLNVPLVDCTEENGSLEFWPRTHLLTGPVDLERLERGTESRRANLKAGSFLLRDLRMWHRGTPNRSSRPRPHLALVYTRTWYRFEQRVPTLTPEAYDGLSDRGRLLLRYARVER
jgi:ectoine hydroxylase-related dioxygenase (phytanoyl-CoA dioxygenase family)